jgi:wee1-like protein kinase
LSPEFKIHRRQRTSTRVIEDKEPNTLTIHPVFSPLAKRRRNSSLSSDECDSDDSGRFSPVEKQRVPELSLSRYQQEFLELSEVASGEFGSVVLARHRLDGSDHAVKVNKSSLRPGSYQEKKALNEVFAHATLNSHKHVVRHYRSWVEQGRVYIQNEFCEGGSLGRKIERMREAGEQFSESDLCLILRHTLQGLEYIHSKDLAHLDIKPDNILISSGVEYKLGDLGHVARISDTSHGAEEGDCRYMAPEFLLMDMDNSQLDKADIFSLGLTLYEAASLKQLPKNSLEDAEYTRLKAGQLPYLTSYTPQLNSILASMVTYSPTIRPSAAALLKMPFLTA